MAVPVIVCLCGSTRFGGAFDRAMLDETLAGKIVLTIGTTQYTDAELFGHLSQEDQDRILNDLRQLHLRKIDLAEEILVLNVGGYIGPHTRDEIAYARARGKRVRFLEGEGPVSTLVRSTWVFSDRLPECRAANCVVLLTPLDGGLRWAVRHNGTEVTVWAHDADVLTVVEDLHAGRLYGTRTTSNHSTDKKE